jgi:IS1 family transposase
MNSWLFPPETREVQFDEKWAFVGKKEKRCDPGEPDDLYQGDCWDYIALDPRSRLVVSALHGKRTPEHVELLVRDFFRRTEGRLMELMTSDENPAYAEAILAVYGREVQPQRQGRRGRQPKPVRQVAEELTYATVHKTREGHRVVDVEARLIYGAEEGLAAALAGSPVSDAVNTVYVERHNGTDRNRNARKVRKTYCFSKDWDVHEAVSYFALYSYNFCWTVRTLREGDRQTGYRQRTPAMAAGLTDHIWTLKEWLSYPGVQRQ